MFLILLVIVRLILLVLIVCVVDNMVFSFELYNWLSVSFGMVFGNFVSRVDMCVML